MLSKNIRVIKNNLLVFQSEELNICSWVGYLGLDITVTMKLYQTKKTFSTKNIEQRKKNTEKKINF